MASYVYFKFKSQKEPQRVTIDGPHTDVWNLKREIISISRLGDGTDFDLKIYKENSNEEYTDDTEIIPKDSTVLARRLPASAPGKGRAARYVSGKPPLSAKPSASSGPGKSNKVIELDKAMTEKERLDAMLKFTDAQWQQKQEEMSHEQRVPIQGGKPMKRANIPEGEPPHGYICYRCGKKGHWIQACPTNDDAAYDNKNRIKRTTGIPRSMLKKIDQADIDKLDESQRQNLMVNAEGEYVFAQADEKAWKKHLEQVKAAEAAQMKVQVGNKELRDRGLECPIDKRLFVDPMKTPCCGRTYCHDCIENALLDSDLTCPGCGTENISLERLKPDETTKTKIKEFQDEQSNERQRSHSPTHSVDTPKAESTENETRPDTRNGSKSPVSVNGQSKKRTAQEAIEKSPDNLTTPAMKRQKSGEAAASPKPQEENSMPSTPTDSTSANTNNQINNNMPFMPPDMSQNMGVSFPMMPMMNTMPFMPMLNPNMMNPSMMNMMNGMMPNMMNMNGMNNMTNMNNIPQQFPNQNLNQNQHHSGNWNQHKNHQYRNKPRPFQQHQQKPPPAQAKQPDGMSGVPTGPKALQNPNQGQNQGTGQAGFHPPTGPAANKFANQQRYTGKEEDNAYMRQPLNPQRQWQKNKRGRVREADYREL